MTPAMLVLLALACDFSAATGVVSEDTAPAGDTGDTAADGAETAGDTAPDDTDSGDTDPDPYAVDDDADGASELDGDCDDSDPTVRPGVPDVCNGVDDDCDDTRDEDATPDGYEPNDTSAASIGDLDDDPELTAVASLAGDGDVDRFSFSFADSSFSLFTVTASLSGIPDDATFRFTLNRLASDGDLPAEEMAQVFGTGTLSLTIEDEVWTEDGGTYELVVEAIAGADCGRTYLVAVAW
jgi:hypothetical protein